MHYLSIFKKNRLLVLHTLYECSKEDVTGCDLIEKCSVSKNLLSYHISHLINKGLVKETKHGRKKFYVINKEKEKDVVNILKAVSLID